MATRKSDQLNAALAASIKAQPISAVQAAIAELRTAGLNVEADELAEVLAAREQQLSDARVQKEREEEAARQKAIEVARNEFDANAEAYVALRDEALDALRVYAQKAIPGMEAYRKVQFAWDNLYRLGVQDVQKPLSGTDVYNADPEFKQLVRQASHNASAL